MRFPGPDRVVFTAGAAIRRPIRRNLQAVGVDFTEDKGVLDSQFTVEVPTGQVLMLPNEWFRSAGNPA